MKPIEDDPIELITRAIMTEEGIKLLTDEWRDAEGVAWVIKNRHEQWYASPKGVHHDSVPQENYWLKAATSGIWGMSSYRLSAAAAAPTSGGHYSFYGITSDAGLLAYTVARLIAIDVVLGESNDDPTNGALYYADAWYPIPNGDQEPWDTTHFTVDPCAPADEWWTMPY